MATQSVIHSVQQQKSAVVVSIPNQSPQQITQTELVLYLSLCARLKQLETQVEAKEAELKARLEAGVSVERGDHFAELKESFRRTVAWKSVAADLANTVFGEGKGLTYCEEVLASTEPSRIVGLNVE